MSAFDLPHSRIDVERLLAERRWVQRLARSLVADPNQADDVAQESWLAALRHPPRHDANLRSWLSRLVRNTAGAFRRGEARRTQRERSTARLESSGDTADALDRAEIVRELVEAVLALDAPRREALVLVYFEGLAPNAAADRAGVPHSTFRSHVRRGLAEVREKLERRRGREHWFPALAVLAGRPETHAVGVMFMKTKLVAASVIILAAFLIYRGWSVRSSSPIEERVVASAETLDEAKSQQGLATPAAVETSRAPLPPTGAMEANELIVEAKWDATGDSAANVQVALSWKEDSGAEAWRQARTDSDGRASFTRVLAGPIRVSVDRGFDGKTEVAAQGTTRYEARILTDVHVRGRVVGPDDEPIANASIHLASGAGYGFEDPIGVSAADGGFDLGQVSRHRLVYARRDDLAASPAIQLVTVQTPAVDLVLRMQKEGCELIGHVVHRDGSPIAGAQVVVSSTIGGTTTKDGLSQRAAPARRVTTDSLGACRLVGLYGAAHSVEVRSAGFGTQVKRLELSSLRPTTVDFTLVPGTRVHGIVRDERGRVVANAVLSWSDRGGSLQSAADGSFTFSSVQPGKARFRVKSEKAGLQIGTLEIPEQEQLEWNPVVSRGRLLEGRVVDESDRPLANWLVMLQTMSSTIDADEPELDVESDFDSMRRTDADGRFTFTNRAKSGRRVLIKSPGNFGGLPALVVEDVEAGTPDLVFRVPNAEGLTVQGRIVDERGHGLGGVTVVVATRQTYGVTGASKAITQDGTGAFTIEKVQPGTYEIHANARGLCEHVEVRVIDAASTALDPIQLVRGGSLVAMLSAEQADMVRNDRVEIALRGTRDRTVQLVGTELRAEDLEPGEWSLDSVGARKRVPGPSKAFVVRAGETTRIDYDLGKLATLKQ